jgi:hypothetical protein
MFGLHLTLPRWFSDRFGRHDPAAGVDPLVHRALTLMSSHGATPRSDDAVTDKLVREELAGAAWIDGGHWVERACRDAAKAARRLHRVAVSGDE